jgi:hypothetical protein
MEHHPTGEEIKIRRAKNADIPAKRTKYNEAAIASGVGCGST